MSSTLRYIATEGVIGVGKTSLATKLAKTFGASLIYEQFEKNPFLEDFYTDPERYAFQTQIFFLINRYRQQQELIQMDLFHTALVCDYIFARDRIFATLNLNDKELKLYDALAKMMEKDVIKPELVIYLQASTGRLLENIRKRNRIFERNISPEYIQALNDLYNNYFFHYAETSLLVINTDEIDFINNEDDYHSVLYEISHHRAGTKYYIPHIT
jgi:deoxyguanosine kinase